MVSFSSLISHSQQILENNELAAGSGRMGNIVDKSIYGTNQVGSQITGGVNIVGADYKGNLSGPRDMVGYAYGSPTGSGECQLGSTMLQVVV